MVSVDETTDCAAVLTQARAVAPCEREQARLFAELPRSEINSMPAAVAVAQAQHPGQKRSRAADDREQRIAWMNDRIDEAKRILDALKVRYGADG